MLAVASARDAYFWPVHSGAELDLLLMRGGQRIGFEFKCEDAPRLTASLRTATADLKLDRAFIVYPGSKTYALDDRTTAAGIADLRRVIG
jgi:hypothetical protein